MEALGGYKLFSNLSDVEGETKDVVELGILQVYIACSAYSSSSSDFFFLPLSTSSLNS